MKQFLFLVSGAAALSTAVPGEITKPADAPKPLAPTESAKLVQLPHGFRLELVAAEPLIRQPSGMCWDEHGSLFVTELHGYNREGQYDIDDLNKTGELDRVVRRISANDNAVRRAEKEQIGTVKRLVDTDGDGVMDRAEVWADGLPVCMGLCPARGGVIVVCSPDILYLADRDGDGTAEVREKLYTGFKVGIIERRINSPQWGPDNWIYVDGGQGGHITGPNLPAPVDLPVTGFRLKPDGSAIEPVPGHTGTYGFTFNAEGDRFVVSTGTPGIQVAPLPWRYLARNPDVAISASRRNAANYNRTFPISMAHPWRNKRAADPGFSKYYRDRYGAAESDPNGYFTSACSPLVYQDSALPGLAGQILACAPAQNFVHRAELQRDGIRLNIRRLPGGEQSEFLASSDIWFHPIHLSIGPAGGIWIADFYREIIEDYSAIPRYLQQQYGLDDGKDHGRIWRLVHDDMPKATSADMSRLSTLQLASETASPRFWRRQTARRLLLEHPEHANGKASQITVNMLGKKAWEGGPHLAEVAINVLYTLEGIGQLDVTVLLSALLHGNPAVRRHGLRLAEKHFDDLDVLLKAALNLAESKSEIVRLQLALSLGESSDPRSLEVLAKLARNHGEEEWLDGAILSSLGGRGGEMLQNLLSKPDEIGQARSLAARLCSAVANRRNNEELSDTILRVTKVENRNLQVECLKGLRAPFESATTITLEEPAREALMRLAATGEDEVRAAALDLTRVFKLESAAERTARVANALNEVANLQLSAERRMTAVRSLASENDGAIIDSLLDAYASATPTVRRAILTTAFARTDYLPAVVSAMEQMKLPPAALNAIQRSALLEQKGDLGKRAQKLFATLKPVDRATMDKFVAALKSERDPASGQAVFSQHCATCHKAHGTGFAVGPDLTSEFRRAEETIIRDILAPSEKIVAGHETYTVETNDGRVLSGILASESAGSLSLMLPGGFQLDVLRKDVKSLNSLPISLMPESLAATLKPSEVANVIAWLRQPPTRQMLFEDSPAFVELLTNGEGTATVVSDEKHSGTASLRITPPQKYSANIADWNFRIREHPGPGEFRYLRLAWKAPEAQGVMVELAHNGAWPSSNSSKRRYYSGQNTTTWQATRVSQKPPTEWTVITRDLWKDFGDFNLTGIAPTALGGPVWFDQIELLRTPND
jgi:putative membrane-bound dehydrogenase-like protein